MINLLHTMVGPQIFEMLDALPITLQKVELVKQKTHLVRFNEDLQIIIIPNRDETLPETLSTLWWTSADYKQFKKEANCEVIEAMQNSWLGEKDVKRALYQPESTQPTLFDTCRIC